MILLFINLLLFLVTRILPAPRKFVWICPELVVFEVIAELVIIGIMVGV
ncbi:hypothetical protein VPHD249_0173 [Vibrio phage D249]|nr:hypothetical protein SIPHO036v1_50008 [Vibrio phage 70E38.1]QZI88064.1 hypothetical protein SIPHO041v1_p0153 [Vibrio phage 234P1]QZI88238.1 hypothetical protein SIPHO035v1_p0147 [Vibrio phage 234P7B]QZI88296.1 hypothetical protein SIPHO082v1_p0019 [Vibrio phage 294E48.1]QZI88604.1 hypothetical protein SIPHO037v1_p0163 [Vibrio phage 70E35.2]QZI88789.1 hypothetical protein SIPHO039v1_p0160 [Vibrio phage 70E35.5a]QZI88972.1 hypothetical protein SIPHO040v1_p0159 [Vibrio phage 70E35.6]QZI89049